MIQKWKRELQKSQLVTYIVTTLVPLT